MHNLLPIEKVCMECGKSFHPWKHTQACCSISCTSKQTLRKRWKRAHDDPSINFKKAVTGSCAICGKQIKIYQHGNSTKTCSKQCGALYRRKSVVVKSCVVCGSEFSVHPPSRARNKSCCSSACRYVLMSKTRRSKSEAYSTYRQRAYRAFSQVCQECGYDEHPEILRVHHKDGNRLNGHLSNLMILCPNCHVLKHIHMQNRWKAISGA